MRVLTFYGLYLEMAAYLRLALAVMPIPTSRWPPVSFEVGVEVGSESLSISLMADVWRRTCTHAQQSILLALVDHGDDFGGRIYPSYAYLAWKTQYSARQVMRVIGELIELGVLKKVERGNSHKKSNRYTVNLAKLPLKLPFRTSDTMSQLDAQPVTACHSTSDISASTSDIAMSHQSSSESPSKHLSGSRATPKDSRSTERKSPRSPALDYNPTIEERQRLYEAGRKAYLQQKKV